MKETQSNLPLHELLSRIVQDFGEDTLTETRLKGLLCDLGGSTYHRYQSIMTRSIAENIGQRIIMLRELDDADFSMKLSNIRQSFQEDNFYKYGIANYIIDCYLFALGWVESVAEYNEEKEDGAKSGEINFVERDGYEYCGNLNQDDERSGFGISKNEDGSYYAGEWKLDLKNGVGINVRTDRSKYAGEWRLNRKAGIGIQLLNDGSKYAGEWKNGKMHGEGIIFYPNGEHLCASFRNGEIETDTNGIFYMKDGTYIIGKMTINGPDGECTHYSRTGKPEKENWIKGKLKTE